MTAEQWRFFFRVIIGKIRPGRLKPDSSYPIGSPVELSSHASVNKGGQKKNMVNGTHPKARKRAMFSAWKKDTPE